MFAPAPSQATLHLPEMAQLWLCSAPLYIQDVYVWSCLSTFVIYSYIWRRWKSGIDSYTNTGWPYVSRARAAPWSSISCSKSCGSWGVQGQWALTNTAMSAEAWASAWFLLTKTHFLYQCDRIPSGRFPSTSMVSQASRGAYYQRRLPCMNAGMLYIKLAVDLGHARTACWCWVVTAGSFHL